jgi:hypothetical protein
MTLDQNITFGANSAFMSKDDADQKIITATYNIKDMMSLSFLEIASMKKSIALIINASVGNPQ